MAQTEQILYPLSADTNDLKPEPLSQLGDQRPTLVQIANSIPKWVKWNLKRVLTANVHYEHQLYGPDNTYLNCIFDVKRRFSVIPQALLRRVVKILPSAAKNPLNVSHGSAGGEYWSRHTKYQDSKSYPDFLVVKVIPTDEQDTRQHYVCAILEIKLEDKQIIQQLEEAEAEGADIGVTEDKYTGISQMYRYLRILSKYPYRDPELQGFLLQGSKCMKFHLSGSDVISDELFVDIFSEGDPLTLGLCKIAHQQWDRDDVHDIEGLPGLE